MRRFAYSIIIIFVTALVVTSLNVGYTMHVQREKDQQMCALWLVILEDPPPPPRTPRQKRLYREIERLAREMNC